MTRGTLFPPFLTLVLVVVFTAHSSTSAAIIVTVDSVNVPVGTLSVAVPVKVDGGEAVTDMAAYMQLDDGGPLFSNPPGPMVTAVHYTATGSIVDSIWTAPSGGFSSFFGSVQTTPTSQVVEPQVSVNVLGEFAITTGTLLTLEVDLTGFSDVSDIGNVYPIFLSNSTVGATTSFQNSGAPVMTVLNEGHITIVPEPSGGFLFLGIVIAGVLCCRFRGGVTVRLGMRQ